MDKSLKDALRKNRTFLKENMADVAGVVDILYAEDILTNAMKEEVMSKKPDSAKTLAMLDILPKRGQKAYQALIDAFTQTGNVDAAQRLNDAREGIVPSSDSNYSVPPKHEIKHAETKEVKIQKDLGGKNEDKNVPPPTETPLVQTQKSTDQHWLLSEMLTNKVSQCAEDFYMKKKKEEDFYDIVANNRGHVLIIMSIPTSGVSNVNRDNETARITAVLKKLGFKVTPKAIKEKTAEEIENTVKSKLSGMDFNQAPSCIVFALSVGEDSRLIYGKSDAPENGQCRQETTSTTPEKLMQIMKDCEKLKGIPKILIYQTLPSETKPLVKLPDEGQPKKPMIDVAAPNDDDAFIVTAKPCEDLEPFIQLSGGDGNQVVGTYFLTSLVYALKNYAAEKSFLEIMEQVHELLVDAVYELPSNENQTGAKGADKVDAKPSKNCQVAQVEIQAKCVKKALYFFPGVKSGGQQPTS